MQSWYRFLLEMSHKTGHINATFISVHSRLLNSRMAVFASQSACSLHQLSVFIPGTRALSISEICPFESAPDVLSTSTPFLSLQGWSRAQCDICNQIHRGKEGNVLLYSTGHSVLFPGCSIAQSVFIPCWSTERCVLSRLITVYATIQTNHTLICTVWSSYHWVQHKSPSPTQTIAWSKVAIYSQYWGGHHPTFN